VPDGIAVGEVGEADGGDVAAETFNQTSSLLMSKSVLETESASEQAQIRANKNIVAMRPATLTPVNL
jgi:hypothetical protein